MNKTINLLAFTTLALVACGDNKQNPDAGMRRDGAPTDAYCSDCPAAPTLGGTQLDRMGRPAINTALNFAFTDDTPTTTPGNAAKDAYNANAAKTTWQASYASEFAKNLAILDVIDGGRNDNGLCELGETNALNPTECPTTDQVGSGVGCGNAVGYDSTGTTPETAYGTLAGVLADDRLYLDTSKTACSFYLAVEFGVVTGAGNTTCGGRTLAYDVIDATYSAVGMGLRGFSQDGMFTPKLGDGVVAHTDTLSAFPYLGAPH